jgi:hypothetical protein
MQVQGACDSLAKAEVRFGICTGRIYYVTLRRKGARMSGPIKVIIVGKWSVGFGKSNNLAILSFEFEDHALINLALQPDQAALMAGAIQDKLRSLPKSSRLI